MFDMKRQMCWPSLRMIIIEWVQNRCGNCCCYTELQLIQLTLSGLLKEKLSTVTGKAVWRCEIKHFFSLKHKSETISATIWLARAGMGDKDGRRGCVNFKCSLSTFLLISPQFVARFSLQPLFSGLSISTYLIEADLNILLFIVPGPSFFVDSLS